MSSRKSSFISLPTHSSTSLFFIQALTVGGQSFALSAPISQERLDVFKLSQHGCMQLGQIYQKAIVKASMNNRHWSLLRLALQPCLHAMFHYNVEAAMRGSVQRSTLQPAQRQQAQPSQHVHPSDLHHVKGRPLLSQCCAVPDACHLSHSYTASAGAAKNGFSQPQIHPVKSRTQQQLHTKALNGTAPLQPVAVPAPGKHHGSNPMPAAKPAWPPTHSQQLPGHSQHHQHHSSSGLPDYPAVQQPQHAQHPCTGAHHTQQQQPTTEAQPHQQATAGAQQRQGVQIGGTAVAQPNPSAPPNSSLESAQTVLPQTALLQKQSNKGKPHKGPAPAAALSDEVLNQVCAAAKLGQKETVLTALLQCKPCKNQVSCCPLCWAPPRRDLQHKHCEFT